MHPFRKSVREFLAAAPVLVPGGVAVLLGTVLGIGWFAQPDRYARGYAPEQPFDYSHRLHAGTLRIPCLYCHGGADDSRYAGVPPVETCMNCHGVTRTEAPEVQKLTAIHRSGERVRWQRIHHLPDHVFFDHRPHVLAEIECQTCHGPVETMSVLRQHMSLRMGNCLGCHREPHPALPPDSEVQRGPEHCNACHR